MASGLIAMVVMHDASTISCGRCGEVQVARIVDRLEELPSR